MSGRVLALRLLALMVLAGCATTPEAPEPGDPPSEDLAFEPTGFPPPAQEAATGGATASEPPPAPTTWEERFPDAAPAFKNALAAARAGDLVGAESGLKALLGKDPKLDYAWTNLGMVYERQSLLPQAERAYQKALDVKPDQREALDALARLLCRTGRADAAESMLRQKAASAPQALNTRLALVSALLHQRKLASAALEAKRVLKLDERNARAMKLLSQVYSAEAKHELAKMVLENARAIAESDPGIHNALGLVQLALKNRTGALESFRRATELSPDYAEAKNNLGALLNAAEDYEAAQAALLDAVQVAPQFVAARLNLGNAYRGAQQFEKALAQYQQVAKLAPNLQDVYFNLAVLHLDQDTPTLEPIARLNAALGYFEEYQRRGGKDDRVAQYVKDARKNIEKETRKKERAAKGQLKGPAPAEPAPAGANPEVIQEPSK